MILFENFLPISGRDLVVNFLAIYIATCLGLAKGLERLGDSMSAKLILKKFEVTFCILSMLIALLHCRHLLKLFCSHLY